MSAPSLPALVNGLADRLGFPIVLEDANQQLMAYSPHWSITDRVREETILQRTTSQHVVDVFGEYDLASRTEPFIVPAQPEAAMLARLCIPVRWLDVALGYAWVLLPSGDLDADGWDAAEEAQEQLALAMLAESRIRARESDSLLSLISSDPDTRVQGLIDVEARDAFQPPRQIVVAVCSGAAWDDAGVRGSFWTAGWATSPRHALRGTTDAEGIALISTAADPRAEVGALLDRARTHIARGDDRLVIGVGAAVAEPDGAHDSYRQARMAARVALRIPEVGPVAWWDQLGIHRFLTQLPLSTLADAVDPRVAELVDRHPVVAETLERFLAHGGAINAVADALHIHRSTLYYRLDRVRSLGLDPGDGFDRAAATGSFAALRLLGRWSG